VIPVSDSDDAAGIATVRSVSRRWVGLAVVGIALMVASGIAVSWMLPPSRLDRVDLGLRSLAAIILFAAASLGLLSGRWVARTSAGFASATLVVLAFAGVTSATSLGQNGFGPVLYTSGAALAVALLLAAAAAPEVYDMPSLLRVLRRDGGPIALLAVAALAPVVEAVLVAGMSLPRPARMVLSVLVATGLCVVGARVLRLERATLGWLPAVLVILAAAALARAFVGVWPWFLLIAVGLEALAGGFALGGAVLEVRGALGGTRDGMTSMLQDLGAMRDEDSRRQAAEIERLHEVRSVLAGLQAATFSLRKYEDSLDPGVRRRLQEAVGQELTRLNHLIDPAPEATGRLDLEAVLMSVVLAQREQGLAITTDLGGLFVKGRAGEIATLVSDLLVNARVHATGSPVQMTARTHGEMVELEVRNWGPALPAADAQRVFERSYRGTKTIADGVPGSGLGLYTARKLARSMHGDLQVRSPQGGGCAFVVSMPISRQGEHQVPLPSQVDRATEPLEVHPLRPGADRSHRAARVHDAWHNPDHVGNELAGTGLFSHFHIGRTP
jgi:signal transduction histidine kinase